MSVGYAFAATAYRKFCMPFRQAPARAIGARTIAAPPCPLTMRATPTNTAPTEPVAAIEVPIGRDP